MHQNAFGGRAAAGLAGGAHSALTDPLTVFGGRGWLPGKGMGREREGRREKEKGKKWGRERNGKEGERRGVEGRGGKGVCPSNFTGAPHFLIPGVALVRTTAQRDKIPSASGIDITGTVVPFRDYVKLLGVTLDSVLTMDRHVTEVIRSCSYHTRALRATSDRCCHSTSPR